MPCYLPVPIGSMSSNGNKISPIFSWFKQSEYMYPCVTIFLTFYFCILCYFKLFNTIIKSWHLLAITVAVVSMYTFCVSNSKRCRCETDNSCYRLGRKSRSHQYLVPVLREPSYSHNGEFFF